MIPREFMFDLWIVATAMSCISAYVLFRRRRNSLAITMISIFGASAGMVSFYAMLSFTTLYDDDPQLAINWSRWAISVVGMVVLGGSIASIILNKGKP